MTAMWSGAFHCSVKALLIAVCFLLWNANQAASHLEGKCSEAQFSPNCQAVSSCPNCVRVSWLPRRPYVFKHGNSTGGFLHGKFHL